MKEGLKEAALWEGAEGGRVLCRLCCFYCKIGEGKRGICGVREVSGGRLYALTYGRPIARGVDPVEKKPLYHFQPGSKSYSVATVGCNFRCLHCQNADISQMPRETGVITGDKVAPEQIVAEAVETGSSSVAYTYTEPTIFFEYARDTALLAKDKGLRNVFVTNGYMTPECIDELAGFLDGANVDVKSMSDDFYMKVCGGAKLAPVLDAVERLLAAGIWVEVTTLVIPGRNDSDEELTKLARWLVKVDKRIPWHISAFRPAYKLMDAPPTPVETVDRAREIGLAEGLRYVYTGNVPGDAGESTYCYGCGEMLIERRGFGVSSNVIKESRCPYCGVEIDGVEMDGAGG